ncbi:hypothetical protein BKP56_11610 [Marinilactibacillus sp. 15R]|uniref:hypothetical protein n=1 Tax=Marinilactibacillus sp. 15R TaxID=1911586 RepID=UPI00090AEA0C|nr:hypothetical protein [Marinilactibacillus sp. 15R]API89868.1 hypothetical protein BKP56_11610 [Marinilactibacillus sp. 15R]
MNKLVKLSSIKKGTVPDNIDSFLLILIAGIFVFSDWIIGAFSLTELLIVPTVVLILLIKNSYIKPSYIKWMSIPIVLLLLHSFLSMNFNENFDFKIGLYGIIKFTFYIIVLGIFLTYIRKYKLEKEFLLWNNKIAIIIGLIGIYITIAIYSDGLLPYEFFWKFTRLDGYLFSTDTFYVRTLSIFYEPAHMGYYINTILAVNFFNKFNFKVNYFYNLLLAFFVVTTFSYSAIAILILILIMAFISKIDFKKIQFDWKLLIPIFILVIIYFVFQETIHTTIIDRTILILQGKEPSVNERLKDSWKYVNENNIWLGNGIGHTPVVWHNYAYMISEFGSVGLILFAGVSLALVSVNFPLGIFFIAMNFSKGGYLSPAFWFLVMMIILYGILFDKQTFNRFKNDLSKT